MITKSRIWSIDVVRGIVMVIMTLDHVRDYFHRTAMIDNPLNLGTTTPSLFFTRWVTHFCAPVFVFLSGTSIYLVSLQKTKPALRAYLIKRGLWIILVGLIVFNFAWSFDPSYKIITLDVLWAIGISMLIIGLLINLPFNVLLVIGLLIIAMHNLLDYPEAALHGNVGFWWALIHYGGSAPHQLGDNHSLLIVYPFLAWTGIMITGYCFGKLYTPNISTVIRQKLLMRLGFCLILLFIILRLINHYGDPHPWRMNRNLVYTILSFIDVHKYPPSLMYTCIMLGPTLILLALAEKTQNRITAFFNVFGKVPMFYFIAHLYFIHLIAVVFFFATGHSFNEAYQQPTAFRPVHFGYSLIIVYLIWILVVLSLYPLCKKYGQYKSTHNNWWLSYW